MCLIKKHKKYQLLYLREKLNCRGETLVYGDKYEGVNEYLFSKESKRIQFLSCWLEKINKKYNYA